MTLASTEEIKYVKLYYTVDSVITHQATNPHTLIRKNYTYSDLPLSSDNRFDFFPRKLPSVRKENDFLLSTYTFTSDFCALRSEPDTFYMQTIWMTDTVIYETGFSVDTINYVPLNKEVYIGIKFPVEHNNVKLGWIKLAIAPKQIHLLETAIER